MSNKSDYLKKNLLFIFVSTVATKIITFLMLPLYTSYISTSDYGIISYIVTLADLIFPITTLCIQNGLLRYIFDETYTKEEIFSSSCYIMLRGSVIYGFGSAIVGFFMPGNYAYILFFFLYGLGNGIDVLLSYFYRGIGKVNIMMEASIIRVFINGLTCVILIAILHYELSGYFWGTFIGCASSIIYGVIRCKLWKYIIFKNDKATIKVLQIYSAPLIITSIGWWVSSFIDRFVVTHYLGTSENGIYSVAYRIPTIITILSQIMTNAWMLSAIKDFDANDSDGFICKTYRNYNFVLILGSSILMLLNIPLAKILYAKDFFIAWKYSGPLIISALFASLSNFYDGIFSHVKDTKSTAYAGGIAAVLNTVLSIILVHCMGIMGVAIGTLIAHLSVWLVKLVLCWKYIHIHSNYLKDIVVYIILCIQFGLGLNGLNFYFVVLSLLIAASICFSYKAEFVMIKRIILNSMWNFLKSIILRKKKL